MGELNILFFENTSFMSVCSDCGTKYIFILLKWGHWKYEVCNVLHILILHCDVFLP